MKKIVVTTDLSESSKAALKFAIQFSSQYKVKLIFFYAIELLIPTHWSAVKVETHKEEEIQMEVEKLKKFVAQTYAQCKKHPGKIDCVVRYGAPVSQAILDFAVEVGAGYICISTRGAGGFKKLMGTHTSSLIRNTNIPLFAIPADYTMSKIKEILYASDFRALRDELRTVKNFAKKLSATVSVLHFNSFVDSEITDTEYEQMRRQRGLKIHMEKNNLEETMEIQLKVAANKFDADVVALFSHRNRSWVERLLFGSNSERASFVNVTPILVYPKLVAE